MKLYSVAGSSARGGRGRDGEGGAERASVIAGGEGRWGYRGIIDATCA